MLPIKLTLFVALALGAVTHDPPLALASRDDLAGQWRSELGLFVLEQEGDWIGGVLVFEHGLASVEGGVEGDHLELEARGPGTRYDFDLTLSAAGLRGEATSPPYGGTRAVHFERTDTRRTMELLAPSRAELERLDALDREARVVWQDGHTGHVMGVKLAPNDPGAKDAQRLVSWGDDGTVRLWDVTRGEHVAILGRHSAETWDAGLSAMFSADGERVLVLDRTAGRASLWDGRGGDLVTPLAHTADAVRSAALSVTGDSAHAASATTTGEITVWDTAHGRPLASAQSGAFPELGFDARGRVLAWSADLRARMFDAETGERIAKLGSDELPVVAAALVCAGEKLLTWSPPDLLALYDLAHPKREPAVFAGHIGAFSAELVSANGTRVASVSALGEVRLFDAVSEELLLDLGTAAVSDVALSPDGTRMLVFSGQADTRLVDAQTGETVAVVGDRLPALARFSADGSVLAVRGNEAGWADLAVTLHDPQSGERFATLEVAGSAPEFDLSRDGQTLAVGDWLGDVTVRRAGREPTLLRANTRRSFTTLDPRGGRVLTGHMPAPGPSEPCGLAAWDLTTGVALPSLPPPERGTVLLGRAFTDGSVLASEVRLPLTLDNVMSGMIFRRHVDGREEASLVTPPTAYRAGVLSNAGLGALTSHASTTTLAVDWRELTVVDRIDTLLVGHPSGDAERQASAVASPTDNLIVAPSPGGRLLWWTPGDGSRPKPTKVQDDEILFVEFAPDGRSVATAGDAGSVRVYDVERRTLARTFEAHRGPVNSVVFHPAGTHLLSAGSDGFARLFDLEAGTHTMIARHPSPVRLASFDASGARIVSTDESGGVILSSFADAREIARCEGHTAAVTSVSFDESGERLVTSGLDHSTRVFDAHTGELLLVRLEMGEGQWLAFEPQGHYTGTPGAADRARIVVDAGRGRRLYPLSSYREILESPETIARSLAGLEVRAPFLPSAPELELHAPRTQSVAEEVFTLELTVRDRFGVDEVRIVQDGEELEPERGDERGNRTGQRALALSRSLLVPRHSGETEVRVRARNVRGILSEELVLHLEHEPPERDLYVLALGIADYTDDRLDLRFPTKDVADITERFAAERNGLFANVHIETLVDAEVTPGRVRRLREEFLRQARPEDTIVVFAAGHGVRTEAGEYFLLTDRSTPEDPYDGLDRNVLESLVTWEKLYARRRVLFLDTCQSGEDFGVDLVDGRARGASSGQRGRALWKQENLDEKAATGLYIIAASSEEGMAHERAGNGVFARALLDGLEGAADKNADGLVDVQELRDFASDRVHEQTGGRQRPTVPRVEGGGAFPLARAR